MNNFEGPVRKMLFFFEYGIFRVISNFKFYRNLLIIRYLSYSKI